MTDTTAPAPVPAPAPHKNRRGGLIFFGLVEFVMGGLCLFFVAIMMVGVFAGIAQPGANGPFPATQAIASGTLYLVAGAVLLTLGVGSMMARRWARDLSLVMSWMWLILGVCTGAAMAFMMPRLMPALPREQAGAGQFVLGCMFVFFGLFGIVVPLAMALFYRSPNVKATCQALDPRPRWTERVPLLLLGLCLWMLFSAITMASMSAYAVLPLGSQIVTGPIAIVVYCAIGALLLYVSWGLYRLSIIAWWVGIAYGVLVAVYCIVAFPHIDYNQVVEAMHMPKTPGMANLSAIYQSPLFLGFLGVFWLLYFGYFILVYKYFRRDFGPPDVRPNGAA